ncbi:MAG: response regulator [Bacteroidales bacterium]|nr:response regulator [Bacteroidales bacterium]
MNRRLIISLAILLLALPSQAFQFTHFNTAGSGISYDGISCIMQDSRGFIWIGTYKGLNRYDGRHFDVYYQEHLGLPSDFIHCLQEAPDGNIWIGTDAGACVYNYALDRFEPILKASDKGDVIRNKVTFLQADERGLIHMLVNDQGYFIYDTADNTLSSISYEESGASGARRLLWLSGGDILVSRFHINLYRADGRMGNLRPLGLPGDVFRGDEIERMFPCDNSSFYVASTKKGLSVVDYQKGSVSVLMPLPGDAVLLDASSDLYGRFWLSTTRGVWMYDSITGENLHLAASKNDVFSLSSSYVTCTYVDKSGGLWIGTLNGGVNYSGPFQDKFEKQYMVSGEPAVGFGFGCFAQDPSGRIWIATKNAGLLTYDPLNHSTSYYRRLPIHTTVCSLCADGEWLWFGTFNGLGKLNTRTGQVKDYGILRLSSGRNDPRVYVLFKTSAGELIAGTTAGLFRYDNSQDKFLEINEFAGIFVTSITEESSGRLWLSSYTYGLFSWDIQAGTRPVEYRFGDGSGLPADKISTVLVDASGNVWAIGFSAGIALFDPQTRKFKTYNRSTNKAFPSDVFFKAVSDASGNLWLASDKGLVEFEPGTERVNVYTSDIGLLDNKLTNSCFASADGDVYFGSDNGFIRFNPKVVSSEQDIPKVVITKLRIGPRNIIRDSNIDLMSSMTFAWDERSFGFYLSVLGQDFPSTCRLQSRMSGFDEDWKDLPASGSIYFYNVPPGGYTLEFRAASEEGWLPIREPLSITVRAPFFQTLPGVALIVLAFIIVLFFATLVLRMLDKRQRDQEAAQYKKAKDEEMYQEKLRFFSHVIHEIKTPLTLIKAPLASVMSKDDLDDEARKDLTVMNNNTEYMSKLVNELLDFVRIEKNGYALNPEPVDLVERLNSMVFDYGDTVRGANLKLNLRCDVPSALVKADTAALYKILNNLLLNAVKYAESYIDVHLTIDSGSAVLEFANDGSPIPDEYREEIFKPFVQYHDDTRVFANGVGIGLPLSKNLAAMHSGSLTLDPRKDCTLFRLTLPLLESEEEVIEPRSQETPELETGRPCILIAEDNKDLSVYLGAKLSEYDVVAAGDGDAALRLLGERNFDLLVSDISMPGKSGLDLCREIRSNIEISHLPIIIMSARASVESKIQAMEAGADLYIEKPFDMEYLRSSIRNILDRRELMKKAFSSGRVGLDIDMFGLPKKDEEFFARFDSLVKENLDNSELSNDFLSERLNMSNSTLTRKIRKLLNTSPNSYIRVTRLSIAAQMLKDSHGNNVSEISYAVGFSNVSYFAKCFKEQYGVTPTEYVEKPV